MSIDMGHPGISWTLQFRARIDGALIELHSTVDAGWHLFIRSNVFFLEGSTNTISFALDMEDIASVTDGTRYSLVITATSMDSRIFLDGYQRFSTTADLSPAASSPEATPELTPGTGIDIRSFTEHDDVLSPVEILVLSLAPTPFIESAVTRPSGYDVAELPELAVGTIFARYRVCGPSQYGMILAAGGGSTEQFNLFMAEEDIEHKVLGRRSEQRTFTTHGYWDQEHWHDVIVHIRRGAVQIYVDGYLEAHLPEQIFLVAVDFLDEVIIDQDASESRLFDEVRNVAPYSPVLNDSQVKELSSIAPIDTQCLFGVRFHDSIGYRIPSPIILESGVVVAGTDQHEAIANDSPNSVNFTVRRSSDGEHTWGGLQTTLTYPGHGIKGISVIDSYIVQDRHDGCLVTLVDHFPGGIDQPNAEAGLGIGERDRYILHDASDATYTWSQDGSVTDVDGNTTIFTVSERGGVVIVEGGQESSGGNVFLADGVDPRQTLLTARTCFLQVIYSDDDGEARPGPLSLNQDVKGEWMSLCGTSPDTGVQLHSGRLITPVYYNEDHKRHFSASVVYPDDGDTTWKCGKSPNDGRTFKSRGINSHTPDTEAAATHEATLIERTDSSLLMPMYSQHPSEKVAATVSTDGGETQSDVFPVEETTEAFCQPNTVPWPMENCPECVVFMDASQMCPYRGRGVLRLSEDGG